MPSYQVYNHKTGSVSSNYSACSTFKTSTFILGDRSGGRKQDPRPDGVTRKEGDREKDESTKLERTVLGRHLLGLQLIRGHVFGTVGENGL